MASIISAPTLAQVEGITRRDFFKSFLLDSGLGKYGTATSGSTTVIGDTARLKSTQYDSKDYVGGWARISYDAGGSSAAPEGEISAITTYAPTHATDHITVNPAITAVAAGDMYELWTKANPRDVIDLLDTCLTDLLYMPCWTILTEVPDGDMEQNNTTDWTAVNATVTKQTAEPTMFGKRYLRVVATAANGYARPAVFRVEPGKKYHISAVSRVSAAATTAKLLVYDETNSADIDSKSSTYLFPNRISFEYTAPATCYTVSIRLTSVEDTMTTEWDEVCHYPIDASDIRLPWWVKGRNQILGYFQLDPDVLTSNIWDWNLKGEQDNRWFAQDRFQGQLRAQSRSGPIGSRPIFMFGLRNETAYANDNTEKKYIDTNLMISCLGFKVYDMLVKQLGSNQTQSVKMTEMRDNYYWSWKNYESQQMEDLSRVLTNTTTPDIFLNDQFARFRY